jgi:hypothetical protein
MGCPETSVQIFQSTGCISEKSAYLICSVAEAWNHALSWWTAVLPIQKQNCSSFVLIWNQTTQQTANSNNFIFFSLFFCTVTAVSFNCPSRTVSRCPLGPTQASMHCVLVFYPRVVECVWNVMAHAQRLDFVFQRKGPVHSNRRGC